MRSIPMLLALCLACPAFASPPEPRAHVESLLQGRLLAPLAEREAKRSRFSRLAPMPAQRRVRLLDDAALVDARGATFFRFAIDARYGLHVDDDSGWRPAAMTGCVYPTTDTVLVQRGDRYYPAQVLLGQSVAPVDVGACTPAATASR